MCLAIIAHLLKASAPLAVAYLQPTAVPPKYFHRRDTCRNKTHRSLLQSCISEFVFSHLASFPLQLSIMMTRVLHSDGIGWLIDFCQCQRVSNKENRQCVSSWCSVPLMTFVSFSRQVSLRVWTPCSCLASLLITFYFFNGPPLF